MKSTYLLAPLAAVALSGIAAAPALAAPDEELAGTSCPSTIDFSESAFCLSLGGAALENGSVSAEAFADPAQGVQLSVYGLNTFTAEEGEAEQLTYTLTDESGETVASGAAQASVLGIAEGITLAAEDAGAGEYTVTVSAEGRESLTASFTVTGDENGEDADEDAEERQAEQDDAEADDSDAQQDEDEAPTEEATDSDEQAETDESADEETVGAPIAEETEEPTEDASPESDEVVTATVGDYGVTVAAEDAFGFAAGRSAVTATELQSQGLNFSLYGLSPGSLIVVSGLPGSGSSLVAYADSLGTAQFSWTQPLWAAELDPGFYDYTVSATPLGAGAARTAGASFEVVD